MKKKPIPLELGTQVLEDPRAAELMECMRKNLTDKFGVIVSGPYVTLRFYANGGDLVQISMQVNSITSTGITEQPDDEDK